MSSASILEKNRDLLSVTAFFSLLMHMALILLVSFKLPEIGSQASTDNTLDVVLLNSSNNEKSDEATRVSSSDNAGGGEDDLEAESPIPWKAVTPSPVQSVERVAEQQRQTTLTPDQYITATTSDVSLQRIAPDPTELENQDETRGKDRFNTNARQLERERLLAKLSQAQLEYNKRPKKEFLSPTTKANGAAEYLDAWKKRVEQVGNANYPIQIKAKKLQGTLILTVEINRNGTINAIKVLKPSKHKLLNDAAMRIIRDASPFAAFPDEDFFRETDILVITRTIHFLPNNSFDSSSATIDR